MLDTKFAERLAWFWLVLFAVLIAVAASAFAQGGKERVLYDFDTQKDDARSPSGGLIFDAAGNLYGVTGSGGASTSYRCRQIFYERCGTVFELSPTAQGFWTEAILYSFSFTDGFRPSGPLVFDTAGNLYGTTTVGGSVSGTICPPPVDGCGTVFELSPAAGGGWTEIVLHDFDYTDGSAPNGGLIFDTSGNLYGTTNGGGGNSGFYSGTVFELSPNTDGSWTEAVLHKFKNSGKGDGLGPAGKLVFDGAGNLYGTTFGGGKYSGGTVFELSPQADGDWIETVLYDFGQESDGLQPAAGLIFDASGNLYGTTQSGGTGGGGTVFELSPAIGDGWTEVILYYFPNRGEQEYVSKGDLVFDSSGNLYGATLGNSSRCNGGCGTIFELVNSSGVWTERILFMFDGASGSAPYASLVLDSTGDLYGAASQGGSKGYGAVYEVAP